jgi:hypothetical protein
MKALIRAITVSILIGIIYYLPIYSQLTLSIILQGIFGHLSVTSIGLICCLIIHFIIRGNLRINIHHNLQLLIIISGSILYLSTLGFIAIDLYGYGYYPSIMFMAILSLCVYHLYSHTRISAVILLIGIISFYYKLAYSANIWDYLLDPLLYLFCLISSVGYLKSNWRKKL